MSEVEFKSRRFTGATGAECRLKCHGCETTGFLREDIKWSPDFAKWLKMRAYGEVIWPCHSIGLPTPTEDFGLKLRPTLQWSDSWLSILKGYLSCKARRRPLLIWLWSDISFLKSLFAFLLLAFDSKVEIVWALRPTDLDQFNPLTRLLWSRRKFRIVPVFDPFRARITEIRAIKQFLQRWSKAQESSWKSLEGWDFHQVSSVSHEPDCRVIEEKITNSPHVSVIIPVHNDARALQLSLRSWLQQKTKLSYEVIVVDDGSDDQPFRQGQHQVATAGPDYRFLRLERPQKRKAGDRQFRAGVVRNVGAAYARGEILIFSDSDILVPGDALEVTARKAKPRTLLQGRRHQLTDWPHFVEEPEQLHKRSDPDYSPYWRDFQSSTSPWNALSSRWKYVSTFYLSLLKRDFSELGWFRKNYVQYGCEDTDLGWRAYQSNFYFQRLDLDVFHLPAAEQRSEYKNDSEEKKRLLAPAFVQLYRNSLSNEVFDELVEPHADLITEKT